MSARILVIGAGLGGLTTALALHRAGFSVEVHEQASVLREAGAGLTLSRGAQSVFRVLGVQHRLAPLMTPSARFPFLHYRTGAVLTGALDFGAGLADAGTADISRQCHRADLQDVLVHALAERLPRALYLGHRLRAMAATPGGVQVEFDNGDIANGDALIAADGVHSTARGLLWGDAAPRFTGQVAYRFVVERAMALNFLSHGRGAVFVGPGCTFNRYTVRSGTLLNCVGIVATDAWVDDGWAVSATRDELMAAFAGWHPDISGLIGCGGSIVKWGLLDRAPLTTWSRGPVTLLGDAAHPLLPFLGMGAALAIEDAIVLARALDAESSVETAFARYESARRPRTEFVRAKSIEQGRLTQGQDPDRYDPVAAPAGDPQIVDYDPTTAIM